MTNRQREGAESWTLAISQRVIVIVHRFIRVETGLKFSGGLRSWFNVVSLPNRYDKAAEARSRTRMHPWALV
jgi:predicted metallopeptidase